MGLELQHDRLLNNEPIIAFVTILNKSGAPLVINGSQPQDMKLLFDITDPRGNALRRVGNELTNEVVIIDPHETRRIKAHVTRHYRFNRPGGYYLKAVLAGEDFRYRSKSKHLDIGGGLPLGKTYGHVPLKPNLRRQYELQYLTREGGETLFLQSRDLPGKRIIGTYTLGRLIRIQPPILEIDRSENLIVIHQSAAHEVTLSTFKVYADRLHLLGQDKEKIGHGFGGGPPTEEELE